MADDERELLLEDFDLAFAPKWNSYIFIVLVVMFGKETHRQSILWNVTSTSLALHAEQIFYLI